MLGSPSIASCMYPPPMVHVSTQPNVLLKKKENHLLQETPTIVYKLILAALMATILVEYKDMCLTIYGQRSSMAIYVIMYVYPLPSPPRFLFLMMYSPDATTPLLPSASVQDSQRPPCLEVVQTGLLVKLMTNGLNYQRPLCSN